MKIPTLALCLLLAVLLTGCKKGGDVVGKWKGSMDVPASAANSPQADLMKGMLANMPLELKADKTFTLTMGFPLEGTWAQSGSTVSLTITKMMGMDMTALKSAAEKSGKPATGMDKPLNLELSSDGNTLTGKDTTGSGGGITFTREK